MDDGNIVVATDECGDNHIQLYFDILFTAGDDEAIEATIVKITNVENF